MGGSSTASSASEAPVRCCAWLGSGLGSGLGLGLRLGLGLGLGLALGVGLRLGLRRTLLRLRLQLEGALLRRVRRGPVPIAARPAGPCLGAARPHARAVVVQIARPARVDRHGNVVDPQAVAQHISRKGAAQHLIRVRVTIRIRVRVRVQGLGRVPRAGAARRPAPKALKGGHRERLRRRKQPQQAPLASEGQLPARGSAP
eukprot:scaffold11355_cov59-Phaeocystis_antarctica.AAC.2